MDLNLDKYADIYECWGIHVCMGRGCRYISIRVSMREEIHSYIGI